jgi:hypothetical protein
MPKTTVTKRIYRGLVKKRARSEINLLRARIKYARLRNSYEVLKNRTIDLHGSRSTMRGLRQLKTKVRRR